MSDSKMYTPPNEPAYADIQTNLAGLATDVFDTVDSNIFTYSPDS